MELHFRRHILRRVNPGEVVATPSATWVAIAQDVLDLALQDPQSARALPALLEAGTEDPEQLRAIALEAIANGELVLDSVPAPTPLPGIGLDPVTLARLAGQPIGDLAPDEDAAVAIELVDADDRPLAGIRYRIEFPDGTSAEGRTNAAGRAVFWGLSKGGQCRVVLPDEDDEAWEHLVSEPL